MGKEISPFAVREDERSSSYRTRKITLATKKISPVIVPATTTNNEQ